MASFQFPPTEREKAFCDGMSLVFIWMKPPVKSAGYSALGDFTITRLSIWLLGIMSNEKALESASELGTAPPLIHTLLYRCDSPLTITNLSSMRLTPGTRRITSLALLSCVRFISCAEMLLTMTELTFAASIMAASVLRRAIPVTFTSPSVCSSLTISTTISFCSERSSATTPSIFEFL